MATAEDLISSSLRLINVLAAGETVSIDMANDALSVFNDMVDSWNTQRLAIYTTSANDFPLIGGQQSYTLGDTGNFNIPRPPAIDGMSAILLNNPDQPIEIPMTLYTVDQWQNNVPVKAVTGTFPYICYDDGGFPLRTLNFWPVPASSGNNVRLYLWQALTQPAALNTAISVPPGYRKAFRFNLAIDLAAEFSQPVPPAVAKGATDSMAAIKSLNMPDLNMQSDLVPSPAGWNWKASEFGMPF